MEEIHIETEQIQEISNDIVKQLEEVNKLFDEMFEQIEKIADTDHEWRGISATKFINNTKIDKQNYYLFKNNINDFAVFLTHYSTEMKNVMNRAMR